MVNIWFKQDDEKCTKQSIPPSPCVLLHKSIPIRTKQHCLTLHRRRPYRKRTLNTMTSFNRTITLPTRTIA
jgi:hypothetical protein